MEGRTISHYRIVKLLGKGAMGVVYLTEDTRLKRLLALKVLSANLRQERDCLQRFKVEAEAVARLNHPNIATLYTVDEIDGQFAIAMEYVEGTPLTDLIPKTGLDLDAFFDLFIPLAEALAHAHDKGVTHRDIKPGNIMITPERVPKILDFGIARIRSSQGDPEGESTCEASLTAIGTIMGSPAYMSPEQASGQRVDSRSDLFSLGIVMYEALTGERPFKGQSVHEALSSILKDEPIPVDALRPGIPCLLSHILRKALQKDLRKRYQTAQDMANDLRAASTDRELPEPAGETTSRSQSAMEGVLTRFRSAPQLGLALGAVCLLVGVVFGWLLFREKSKPLDLKHRVYRIPMEGTSSPITGGGPSISPDGRMIAYVQEEGLWFLDLNTGDSTRAPGISGVEGQPFWSPDGRHVGYMANLGRTLRKVSIKDHQSTTVCDVSESGYLSSATWGSGGSIVFDLWGGDWTRGLGLLKVSPEGGKPERILQFDAAEGKGCQAPYELPDGKGLLFVTVHPDGVSEILVKTGEASRGLLKVQGDRLFYPVYSTSGHLLYQRGLANNYGIWAVPFSLTRLETTGEPFLVARNGAWPSVSRDGTLTYVSEPPYKQQLVWLSRKGEILSPIGPPLPGTQIGGVALSPDQARVAIDAFEGGPEDTWVVDVGRGTRTRLTFNAYRDADVAWAPDGGRVAFSSEKEGMSDLFTQLLDPNARADLLVHGIGDKFNPHWASDGRSIAFEMVSAKTKRDLWFLPVLPRGERASERLEQPTILFLQTPFDEAVPQISPDGRFLAYMSDVSGQWEVYVRRFPDGSGESLVSRGGGGYPRWSSRGDELFYASGDTLMAAKVLAGPSFKAAVPEKLFDWKHLGLYFTRRYDVSGDGQRFVAVLETSEGKRFMNIMENWHRAYATQ
ncbi:MAG: protein kinase [Syntrophobacteraceae bacterium]